MKLLLPFLSRHCYLLLGRFIYGQFLGLIIAGGFGQYLLTQAHLITAEWQAIFISLAGGIGGHKLAKWRQKDSKQNKALAPQILQRVIATKPV